MAPELVLLVPPGQIRWTARAIQQILLADNTASGWQSVIQSHRS